MGPGGPAHHDEGNVMANVSKPRPGLVPVAMTPAEVGGTPASAAPRPPAHLGLRRAAEIVEGAAYDLAGRESPVFISRLIEIAAELDRHARSGPTAGATLLELARPLSRHGLD